MLNDFSYGFRMIRRNPGITAVAVLTLALGIGANTAMFSVLQATLFRPVPYKDPDRLVTMMASVPAMSVPYAFLDYRTFGEVWRGQSRSYESISAQSPVTRNLTSGSEPERVRVLRVNASFFPMLGVKPMLGRDFTAEDDQPGAAPVVMLTHELWQRRFGSDRTAISRPITMDGQMYTIVGVLPPKFFLVDRTIDMYSPIAESTAPHPGMSSVGAYARLKPGVSVEQAQAELTALCRRLLDQGARLPKTWTGRIWKIRNWETRSVRSSVLVLGVAVALVLLIACANVANLLLVRAAARQKEIAIRCTLGAGRSRIARQLIAESLLLGMLGAAAGLLFGYALIRILPLAGPKNLTFLEEISLNGPVFVFTLCAALVTAVLFGIAPAFAAARTSIVEHLKETGRGAGESVRHGRLRSVLTVVEVALALLLVVGSTLTIRSLWAVQSVSPGFQPDGVLTASVALPRAAYPEPPQRLTFYTRLLERLQAMPGVKNAGIVTHLPFSGSKTGEGLFAQGHPPASPSEVPILFRRVTDPKYFATIQATLRSGRYFTEQDTARPPVAIVNETMARRLWRGEDALGKRFGNGRDWMTVVGIIGDIRHTSLTEDPDMEFFVPYATDPQPSMSIVLRTSADPMAMAPALHAAVLELDKDLPVSRVADLAEVVSDTMGVRRLSVALFALFAALALVLAAVGIYGVISYSVSRRTHEMGVRMALGAEGGRVLRMVVRQALVLSVAGVALGIASGMALTRLMRAMLFQVSATDPTAFVGASLFLLAVAAVAGYVPARRAARVDPMIALRHE